MILCEGEKATNAAQRLFPDHACISWFGGTAQVEHADVSPLINRKVIVWPDADEPGLGAARKLIPRLPDDAQAVRPDGLPEKFDAANLEEQGCDEPAAWLKKRLMLARDLTGVILQDRFSIDKDGLWYQPPPRANSDTEPEPLWLCAQLHLVAETCDDTSNNHGLLLRFTDRAGYGHTWAMPLRMVHGDGAAIAAELGDAGLSCGTSRAQHERLKEFLGRVKIPRRVRCVDQAGWHGNLYVLPNGKVLGADPGSIVLQTEYIVTTSAYAERGTLEDWRNEIARYAVGNDVMALSISGAFAAPLLKLLNEPSGGVHFHSPSRTGKTNAAERSAMSVYGPGDNEHLRTWRATANGLEAAAVETNDGLLPLDELSQANPREAGQIVYTLANGVGKTRANRAGGARPVRSWCAFFISTGEVTLEQKLAEAGLPTRAGQDVRMIELPADAETGYGVWQNLHGFPSGAALSDHLCAAASANCYGTAGPAYLDQLAHDRADDPELLANTLHALRKEFLDLAHTPANAGGQALIPADADGQVLSVAGRLASVAAAGELATAYGVTGWPEGEARRAAIAGLERWLKARGGTGAGEDVRAVEKVRAFISLHRSSRFELEDTPDQRIINCAGWRLRTDKGWNYLITPTCWKGEVVCGLNPQKAADAVDKAGFLVRDNRDTERRRTVVRRVAQNLTPRGYLVRGTILEGDDDGK